MMLIDTGAVRLVFPPSSEDRRRPPYLAASLTAANGSPILSYSTKLLLVSTLGRRYKWNFIVADVRTPLLGADFLAHYGLAVDISSKRLLDTEVPPVPAPGAGPQCAHSILRCSPPIHLPPEGIPEVFRPELRQVPGACAKHGIYHHIKTQRAPTHAKF
ncbi:uncharacterized protein [Macrobrachium rosenbergii]|uniref:uncharacterized protein n=1 Tax=Macrobrachium rosenbergii TaxID=79674 RepID=UPI0034D64468